MIRARKDYFLVCTKGAKLGQTIGQISGAPCQQTRFGLFNPAHVGGTALRFHLP
jgi:hypothetical protein